MKFAELLKNKGKRIEDIEKIYHGKNHWCRCGCGGNYFGKEDKGFKRALNALMKDTFQLGTYEEIEACGNYVNIPEGAEENNKCYCIYFAD